ncbi:MAG: DNA repair protein RecO [Flammeovirgaceae bacterium]|nr:MAG: DNA repair protein RecO [Flammeovirgaceae bacterium]
MLQKTRGIVFRFTRFRETSIIVTIFTEHFGLQSYIVNGVRSASAKGKMALYQPLTLLDLVAYHKEHGNIMRLKEVKCLYHYQTISTNIKKSTIVLFLAELVSKTVKDESHAPELFDFLSGSLITLDEMKSGFENFHLVFLVRLSRLLGFGAYSTTDITGGRHADETLLSLIGKLVTCDYQDHLELSLVQRRDILDWLLRFYKTHMDSLGEFKSVQVLKEVLS